MIVIEIWKLVDTFSIFSLSHSIPSPIVSPYLFPISIYGRHAHFKTYLSFPFMSTSKWFAKHRSTTVSRFLSPLSISTKEIQNYFKFLLQISCAPRQFILQTVAKSNFPKMFSYCEDTAWVSSKNPIYLKHQISKCDLRASNIRITW